MIFYFLLQVHYRFQVLWLPTGVFPWLAKKVSLLFDLWAICCNWQGSASPMFLNICTLLWMPGSFSDCYRMSHFTTKTFPKSLLYCLFPGPMKRISHFNENRSGARTAGIKSTDVYLAAWGSSMAVQWNDPDMRIGAAFVILLKSFQRDNTRLPKESDQRKLLNYLKGHEVFDEYSLSFAQ